MAEALTVQEVSKLVMVVFWIKAIIISSQRPLQQKISGEFKLKPVRMHLYYKNF